ncbi:MAG: hypothetical protein IPM92_04335 [Saprospiraceae bacterium]|nr:hypothetical protein [Saprospiraceae bacterium]
MPINISGFQEVFDILKELVSGVKSALQIPEKHRKEMLEAVADTAELVDETLTILKQHLTGVISELKFGDQQKAKQLISELGSFPGWETKYRQFQLCDKLREASFNLERRGLYALLNRLIYNDPDLIKQKMWDYIGGEANAANSVGTLLLELSSLDAKVDSEFDTVVNSMEQARNEVSKWRQVFIDFEKELRA